MSIDKWRQFEQSVAQGENPRQNQFYEGEMLHTETNLPPESLPTPTSTYDPMALPVPIATARPIQTLDPKALPSPTPSPVPTESAQPLQTLHPSALPSPIPLPAPIASAQPLQALHPRALPSPMCAPIASAQPLQAQQRSTSRAPGLMPRQTDLYLNSSSLMPTGTRRQWGANSGKSQDFMQVEECLMATLHPAELETLRQSFPLLTTYYDAYISYAIYERLEVSKIPLSAQELASDLNVERSKVNKRLYDKNGLQPHVTKLEWCEGRGGTRVSWCLTKNLRRG